MSISFKMLEYIDLSGIPYLCKESKEATLFFSDKDPILVLREENNGSVIDVNGEQYYTEECYEEICSRLKKAMNNEENQVF